MTPQRLRFSIRGWFQILVMPALILVSLILGLGVYRSLHRVILRSFEQKLGAVSTATAAFILPEDHERLMVPPRIDGLAFTPDGQTLFALDGSRDVLLRINPANGAAEEPGLPVPAGLRHLVFSAADHLLLALDPGTGRVVALDPDTGAATPRLTLAPGVQALAPGPDGGVLALGDRLLRLDLGAGTATPVGSTPLPRLLGAGYDPAARVLRAVGADHRLLEIDPATGAVRAEIPLTGDLLPHGDLAYDPLRRHLLGATHTLLGVDPVSGEVTSAQFLNALGRELIPPYRTYVQPMRRLLNDLDLSYLYTQTVADRDRITYGLDATVGKNHSPLYAQDTLPASEIAGVQDLMRSGALHHTSTTSWEQWGQIKGTYAPILDAAGRVIAMAGADFEVSVIEQRTRRALLGLLVVGAFSIVLAATSGLLVARVVRRPLQQIKSTALAVAAGDYSQRIPLDVPREARRLALAFNQMSASLEAGMQTLHSSIRELLRNRDRFELARRLGQHHGLDAVLGPVPDIAVHWRPGVQPVGSASGAVRAGDSILLWFADSPADNLAAARARADLALRIAARWRQESDPNPAHALPVPGLTGLPFSHARPATTLHLPDGVRTVALVDLAARKIRLIGAPADGTEVTPGGVRFHDPEVVLEFTGFQLTEAPA